MTAEINIELAAPLVIDGGTCNVIVLRAPTLQELREFGEPVQFVQHHSGVDFVHNHHAAIDAYTRRLIVSPENVDDWIGDLGLADTFQIIDAVLRLWLMSDDAARQTRLAAFPESERILRR